MAKEIKSIIVLLAELGMENSMKRIPDNLDWSIGRLVYVTVFPSTLSDNLDAIFFFFINRKKDFFFF